MDGHEHERDGIDYDGDYEPRFHGFHDLMRFKVREILLVSSLYDAFILEEDGRIGAQLYGEYKDLSLSSPPRVFRVSSGSEALDELKRRSYDMVITMSHLADLDPYEFGGKVKAIQPDIPTVLLVTDETDLRKMHSPGEYKGIDKVFFWTGDAALFLAIIKWAEDKTNMEADIQTGIVGAVLVIENSSRFYSMFLPLIYTEIVSQTSFLVAEGLNDHEKLLRRRARPKILLAETFEEAVDIYEKYRGYLLGVITDVTYPVKGEEDEEAGFKFIELVDKRTPALIQSSHPEHSKKADELDTPFLDKNSPTLLQDIRTFLTYELGFGDFIFRFQDGTVIDRAKDMREIGEILPSVPGDSLEYHGLHNHFSNWLMARGEIHLALVLKVKKVSDFKDIDDMRKYLIYVFKKTRRERHMGVIADFSKHSFEFEGTISRSGGGSLGGKGRGIAFLSTLLSNSNIHSRFPNYKIKVPDSLIIGTGEFDKFIKENGLQELTSSEHSDAVVEGIFCGANISEELEETLRQYTKHVDTPIAVRSSSLLEDSQNQPFAGIYATYILPNNHSDELVRASQLAQAVKMVYASAFSKAAKAYISTTVHTSEEERMGVVIQRLVGNHHDKRYYPIFSGVAQSYNFYPVSPLTREDGIASVALGLGNVVVEGGNVLGFSPHHPKVIHGFTTPKEVLKNSQHYFYSLNMDKKEFDLCEGEDVTLLKEDVSTAEKDNTLDYLASTYDSADDRIRDGVGHNGPKIITFASILKYDMYPLAEILQELLSIGEMGMGRPVEMEFAVNMGDDNKLEFSVLQIRPLVAMREKSHVKVEETIGIEEALIFAKKVLGNGVVEGIEDIIVVPPDKFDSSETVETASEIGEINEELGDKPYILVGPGRWGTRDRFLGIPVEWDQISGARSIVEYSMEDFRIDPSHGSHFFHNMTSLGIAYFTLPYGREGEFIDWEWINSLELVKEDAHVLHFKTPCPVIVKVDGRSGRGVVLKPGEQGGNSPQ